MLEYPPLSLYVHLPWCVRKCPYCDFNSHQLSGTLPEQAYVQALCDDLRFESARRSEQDRRALHSIFFGGGTPSMFSARSIATLLDTAAALIGFEDAIEITLEANPGSMDAAKCRDYRLCGVNRLSLGIQSFQQAQLQALGRIHDAAEARRAIQLGVQAGFDNFNLDLMHGLPRQTVGDAMQDLEQALAFQPTHVSWYQLAIEPNTVFYRNPPALPDETLCIKMQCQGQQRLAASGFQRYEVSAFSQPRHHARHNVNYWKFGDYLGIGAGAHGKLSVPASNTIIRTRKKQQPTHYMAAAVNRDAARVAVEPAQRPLEFLLNALRLQDGFTMAEFENRTGVTFTTIGKQVESLAVQQLLAVDAGHIKATERGYRLLDSLVENFLATEQAEPGRECAEFAPTPL